MLFTHRVAGALMSAIALFGTLAAAPTATAAPTTPEVVVVTSAVGTTTQIQLNLSGLAYLPRSGVDGSYGPATTSAARTFQNQRCLDTDGKVGSITWGELVGRIKLVQAKVGTTADGVYGSGTLSRVKAWQSAHGLTADGIAGPATMSKMGIARTYPCGGPIVGDPKTSSATVACYPGTRDLGLRTDGYVGGAKITIRLCAIPGLSSTGSESTYGSSYYVSGASGDAMVNSRVSGAFYGLYLRAKRSGISMTAGSSFRTMAHQTYLYNHRSADGAVARPGYSNHQAGNAIDFKTGGSFKSGASCTYRSTATSTLYYFLRRNAPAHKLGQLSTEAWHWQPLSMSSSTCS